MNTRKCIATYSEIHNLWYGKEKKKGNQKRRKKNGTMQNFGHTVMLGQEIKSFGTLPCWVGPLTKEQPLQLYPLFVTYTQ